MKTLEDFNRSFNEHTEAEQKEILYAFLNEIILDLGLSLSDEQIEHLKSRLKQKIGTNISIGLLKSIRNEIIGNYKRYLPFCYASIITAKNNLK